DVHLPTAQIPEIFFENVSYYQSPLAGQSFAIEYAQIRNRKRSARIPSPRAGRWKSTRRSKHVIPTQRRAAAYLGEKLCGNTTRSVQDCDKIPRKRMCKLVKCDRMKRQHGARIRYRQ